MDGINPYDLKQFIRHRCNYQLKQLGLGQNWKNIDKDSLERMSWFNVLAEGISQTDFLTARETEYSKVNMSVEDMW